MNKSNIIKNLDKSRLDVISDILDKEGFILIKDLFYRDKLKEIINIVRDLYSKNSHLRYKGLPKRDEKDLRIYNLPKRDKVFCDLIAEETLEKILINKLNDKYYRWLPPEVPNYIINSFNARSSGYALDLHIDSVIPFTGNYPISYVVVFVLEDMKQENGATILVPKSHKSGEYTDRKSTNIKMMHANSGDVLILDSRTWHGTAENLSTSTRWTLNAHFSIWSMKQQVDFKSSIPKNIINKLSNKQKQLLGFCSIPPKSEMDRINIKCGYEIFENN